MITRIATLHALVTSLGLMFWFLYGDGQKASAFTAGALLGLFHITVMVWCWQKIFRKKAIALAVAIIVFKYAVLGSVVYEVLTRQLVDPLAFMVGLGVVLPVVMLVGYFEVARLAHGSAGVAKT